VISIAALLFSAATAQASGTIFSDSFDNEAPLGCPDTITTSGGTLTHLTTSDIWYGDLMPYPGNPARLDADVTEWDNIWGHGTGFLNELVTPWPGVIGAGPVIRDFRRTSFIAAHFNTGDAGDWSGFMNYPTNVGGPNIDVTISRTCGDFSANTANPACVVLNHPSDETSVARWWFRTGNTGSICHLDPNTDYYLNIKLTNPASTVECPASAVMCPLYTTHNWSRLN